MGMVMQHSLESLSPMMYNTVYTVVTTVLLKWCTNWRCLKLAYRRMGSLYYLC